jgi:hypothetical protein
MAENRELNLVVNVQGGESVQNLKTQIREAKREVEQFEEGSEGFVRASQNVARLSDKLDDVNDQVKLLKGDALERVAGGFKGIGGAILDLDVGKLAMANQSLKSIPFKDLIGNAKGFGKELLTLATNPLFLIPAAIGLIIANFDKLLQIFPGLGAIVDGVKAIFDQLIDAVLGLINWAGELYEEFRPIIDVLFPLIGIIGMITDLIAEQGNTAEASSKRKVEAEKKYKESVDESNKSIGESRRRILVATGKMSEEQAERERLKEDFLTNYLRAQEEIRTQILEEGSKEAKAVAKAAGDLRLKALQDAYTKDLVELNKNVKDKSDAEKKAAAEKSKADSDKRKEDNEKAAADNLKDTAAFNQKLKQSQLTFATEEEKINEDTRKKIAEFDKAFADLTDAERTQRTLDYLEGLANIEIEGQKKINALKQAEEEKQKAKEKEKEDERKKKESESLNTFTSTLISSANARLTEEEKILNDGNNRKLELQRQFDSLSAEEKKTRQKQLDNEIIAIDAETKDKLDEQAQTQLEKERQLQSLKLQGVSDGLSAISSLTELFAGKSREQQRKAFNIQKGVSIAQAGIATFESATKAFNSLSGIPVVGPVLGGIAAAAAVAAGLANIKKIASQKFDGGGDKSPPPPPDLNLGGGGGGGTNGGPITAPIFNLGGQQIGGASNMLGSNNVVNGQQPIKVFVSETDISNVSNKVKVTEGNSLFGGGG